MVSVGGNLYRVPDCTRKRAVEVDTLADEIQIFEAGRLIAAHPVLEGRRRRIVAPGHRQAGLADRQAPSRDGAAVHRTGDVVGRRPLEFYDAVARRLADAGHQP